VICNDYELELLRQKTGLDEAAILSRAGALIVTRGEHGSMVHERNRTVAVPAVPPMRIVDPTGVGDAFRGGLMKGISAGAPLEVSARIGAAAATYALHTLAVQSTAHI